LSFPGGLQGAPEGSSPLTLALVSGLPCPRLLVGSQWSLWSSPARCEEVKALNEAVDSGDRVTLGPRPLCVTLLHLCNAHSLHDCREFSFPEKKPSVFLKENTVFLVRCRLLLESSIVGQEGLAADSEFLMVPNQHFKLDFCSRHLKFSGGVFTLFDSSVDMRCQD
jgi:hypothetical protein